MNRMGSDKSLGSRWKRPAGLQTYVASQWGQAFFGGCDSRKAVLSSSI